MSMMLIILGLGVLALIVIVAIFGMRHDDDSKNSGDKGKGGAEE